MKKLLYILLVLSLPALGQQEELVSVSRQFHEMLVKNDSSLKKILDKDLTYGHSNGWVETKKEMLQNLASGKMKYLEIKEDSVEAVADKKLGHIRFLAQLTAVLDGKTMTLKLRVLEVWRKKEDGWKLFARQAVRAM